jgi:hypothetical protein
LITSGFEATHDPQFVKAWADVAHLPVFFTILQAAGLLPTICEAVPGITIMPRTLAAISGKKYPDNSYFTA